MPTIREEKEFSKVAKYIPLSEAGLGEITQQVKWLNALDKAMTSDTHNHVMKGNRIHFEMERKKTHSRIDIITKNFTQD